MDSTNVLMMDGANDAPSFEEFPLHLSLLESTGPTIVTDLDLLPLTTDAVTDWEKAPIPTLAVQNVQPNLHMWLEEGGIKRHDDESSVDDTSPPVIVRESKPKKNVNEVEHVRGNVSHTRRCRQKVNNNFERLLNALPPPPEGVEVKHKAQILSYAIERFRTVRCHNMHLEMQLAMSSPYQMRRWVQSVVGSANNLREALKPFMALICLTKKWKYAELWAPQVKGGGKDAMILRYLTGALPPTLEGDELRRLKMYRSNSRKFVFKPRSGVPGRVFLTMRPEWLPLLNDEVAFPRAPYAVRHKVEVTFAVPVIVNGSVQMVVEFFDTKRRDYDPETLNMANEIAAMFGKAYTGQLSNIGSIDI